MSSLESALRSALEKGDLSDPLFRRKVYEAAAGAMHRSLEAKGNAPKEAFDQQKLRLANAIRVIEADLKSTANAEPEVEPVKPDSSPAPVPPAADGFVSNQVSPEPRLETATQPPEVSPEPVLSATGHSARLYVEPNVDAEPLPKPIKTKPPKATKKQR